MLSSYRIMWMFALFDLPVQTKRERRDAARFRHHLQDLGFSMLQYSVYARPCNRESDARIMRSIESALPLAGRVAILMVTDRQYELMRVYRRGAGKQPEIPEQFTLF